MKNRIADTHYRVMCLRIQPTIGSAIQLTQHPTDLKMSNGKTYLSSSGYQFTGFVSSSNTSPASFDFDGIAGLAGISRDAISSGAFDNAKCYLFACDWRDPQEDYEPIVSSILGKVVMMDDRYRVEEMALIDAMNQSQGFTYTAACPKVFGGQEYGGCMVNKPSLQVGATITAILSPSRISASSLGQPPDYFALGTIQFTSGKNVGLKPAEIKNYNAGNIEVFEPFYYEPAIGDSFIITPGCRKRISDCNTKFNNVINFGGFPYIPTGSQYAQVGGT